MLIFPITAIKIPYNLFHICSKDFFTHFPKQLKTKITSPYLQYGPSHSVCSLVPMATLRMLAAAVPCPQHHVIVTAIPAHVILVQDSVRTVRITPRVITVRCVGLGSTGAPHRMEDDVNLVHVLTQDLLISKKSCVTHDDGRSLLMF